MTPLAREIEEKKSTKTSFFDECPEQVGLTYKENAASEHGFRSTWLEGGDCGRNIIIYLSRQVLWRPKSFPEL